MVISHPQGINQLIIHSTLRSQVTGHRSLLKIMNKLKLIEAIAKESGLPKSDALKAMDAFLSVATRTLKKGEKIMLKDFGTFQVVKRAARTARNINTNREMKIPAKKVVRFVVGKELGGRIK